MNSKDNKNTTPRANPNIYSPLNDSLRQSLYIAALDRQFGMRGLISPVIDESNDLNYDFFHVETGKLIKIFKSLDTIEMGRYEQFRPTLDPIYIIEAEGLPEQPLVCDECGEHHPPTESQEVYDAIMVFNALLFQGGCLWEWDDEGWVEIGSVEDSDPDDE